MEGCFHPLKQIPDSPERIYVAEGFATAASVKSSLINDVVVTAFNAGNLSVVCKNLKEKYPKTKILFHQFSNPHLLPPVDCTI